MNPHITIKAKKHNRTQANGFRLESKPFFPPHRSEEPRNSDSEEPDHGQRRCLQVHSEQRRWGGELHH